MDKLRLVYEQTRRAIWMSHLDTMRTLQRAIKRAGIPIRYSEGFNPHELISILLPLSVGTASLCQIADRRDAGGHPRNGLLRERDEARRAQMDARERHMGIRYRRYGNRRRKMPGAFLRPRRGHAQNKTRRGTFHRDRACTRSDVHRRRRHCDSRGDRLLRRARGESRASHCGGADTPSGLCAGRRPLLPHSALSRRRNALPIISKFLKLGVDIFQRHDIITLAFDMRECWNR